MPLRCMSSSALAELLVGVLGEVVDAHVAGLRVDHEVRGDRSGCVISSRITSIGIRSSRPLRRMPMLTNVPFGPLQLAHGLSLVHPLASSLSMLRDDVAAADALAVGGRPFEHARRP